MAKWTVTPGSAGNSMSGKIDYDRHGSVDNTTWQIEQDHKPFVDMIKEEKAAGTKDNVMGARKFATIPDIVAIEVLMKHGIDIHDPAIMKDRAEMTKFKRIIMQEYPHLVVNKA